MKTTVRGGGLANLITNLLNSASGPTGEAPSTSEAVSQSLGEQLPFGGRQKVYQYAVGMGVIPNIDAPSNRRDPSTLTKQVSTG